MRSLCNGFQRRNTTTTLNGQPFIDSKIFKNIFDTPNKIKYKIENVRELMYTRGVKKVE